MLQSYQFQTTLIQATSDKPCMHSTIIFNYMQRLNPNHYENDRIVSKFSPQQKIMKSRVRKAMQVGGCTLSSEKSESFAIALPTTGQLSTQGHHTSLRRYCHKFCTFHIGVVFSNWCRQLHLNISDHNKNILIIYTLNKIIIKLKLFTDIQCYRS